VRPVFDVRASDLGRRGVTGSRDPLYRSRVGSFDAEALERARGVYPDVRGDAVAFSAHVATREGARIEHLAELWLAWAAGRGDVAALRHLTRMLELEADAAARRIDRTRAFVDEVGQALRIRLLVAEAGRARIDDYMGRGPLRGWLAVAALRVALNLKRGTKASSADVLGDLVDGEADPELRHLKTLYRAEYREALEAALAALSERERAVLRLTYVDGLTMVKLARLYGVHETTTARWVRQAAEAVAQHARRRLTTRLKLSPSSLDSVARMVLSNLDLSISRVLRS
jgi:RNA polymerase sigma-70 factor (ECF subfamily)